MADKMIERLEAIINRVDDIDKMLCEKGINWEDFDNGVKYGRFIYKVKIVTEIPQLNETTERYAWHIRNAFKITENKERFNELNIIPKME